MFLTGILAARAVLRENCSASLVLVIELGNSMKWNFSGPSTLSKVMTYERVVKGRLDAVSRRKTEHDEELDRTFVPATFHCVPRYAHSSHP